MVQKFLFSIVIVTAASLGTAFAQASVCDRSSAVVSALESAMQMPCDSITESNLNNLKELTICGGFGGSSPDTMGPQDLLGLKNLQKLTICQGKLTSIAPETFVDQEKLTELWMFSLQIQNLPRGQFRYLKNLNKLFFIQQPLRTVDPDALEGLDHLTLLSFDTFDSSFEVPADLLKHVPELIVLNFGFTPGINEMPAGFLQYTKHIERMWLGWLDLRSSENEIIGLKKLWRLWLNYCSFSENFLVNVQAAHPNIEIRQNL